MLSARPAEQYFGAEATKGSMVEVGWYGLLANKSKGLFPVKNGSAEAERAWHGWLDASGMFWDQGDHPHRGASAVTI